uniref:Preprotein translocase subunit Y n=1 Tax=Nitzschia sp. PL3-2 TaxID=2083271 RepID=A0A2Z5ZAS6_9STRA|nr:preprotein translocase subunit Y [Nitzschia sp. PL3-2]
MGFFKTFFKNIREKIFKKLKLNKKIIKIVLKKLIITLIIICFTILGDLIPVPGTSSSKNIISIFHIGVYPYINAGSLIYSYVFFSPNLKKLKNNSDPHIFNFIEKSTRILTIILIIIKSFFNALFLKNYVPEWTFFTFFDLFTTFFAGAVILLLFSELISKYGLGNGNNIIGSYRIVKEFVAIILYYSKNIIFDKSEKFLFFGSIFFIFNLSFFLSIYYKEIPLVLGEKLRKLNMQKKFKFYLPLALNHGGISSLSFAGLILKIFPFKKKLGILYFILLLVLSSIFNFFYTIFIMDVSEILRKFQMKSILLVENESEQKNISAILKELVKIALIGPFFSIILTMVPSIIAIYLNINVLLYLDASEVYNLISSFSSIYTDVESIYLRNFSI